jgi:hypothetical protein
MNLTELFAKIWKEHNGGLTPDALRDKAFPEIPAEDYGDLLYETMIDSCRTFVLMRRHDKPAKATTSTTATTASDTAQPRAHGRSAPAGQANSARSSKQRQTREQWPVLRCSFALGGGPGAERKNLESMSPEECRRAAQVNRANADGNLRRAEWLERIAEEQIRTGAKSVAKLPTAVLDRIQKTAP